MRRVFFFLEFFESTVLGSIIMHSYADALRESSPEMRRGFLAPLPLRRTVGRLGLGREEMTPAQALRLTGHPICVVFAPAN